MALASFLPQFAGQTIFLMSDNATVVVYLRNQECNVSWVMRNMACKALHWTKLHSVTLSARCIPGKKIVLWDQMSRLDQVLPTEWSLAKGVRSNLPGIRSSPSRPLYIYLLFQTR